LEAFAKFGSDLDKATQQQLHRGERLVEILKQDQYAQISFEKQIVIIYAAANGHLDTVDIQNIKRFEKEYIEYLEVKHPDLLPKLAERKEIDEEIDKEMVNALESFLKGFKQEAN
jgi:F-type H+-transporting ATPase subunit alpha